jgi:hypothetical protein
MEEPFQRGELVTLRDVDPAPLGRILTVTTDGREADIAWRPRASEEPHVTRELTVALRRIHESEVEPGPE